MADAAVRWRPRACRDPRGGDTRRHARTRICRRLRYLLWVAALLTPRPPGLMVLNEPETSLHPDLLPALARLIASAAARTQIIVVSHAAALIEELTRTKDCCHLQLEKFFGETALADAGLLNTHRWEWPSRSALSSFLFHPERLHRIDRRRASRRNQPRHARRHR